MSESKSFVWPDCHEMTHIWAKTFSRFKARDDMYLNWGFLKNSNWEADLEKKLK